MAGEGLPTSIVDSLNAQTNDLLRAGSKYAGQFDRIRQREFYSRFLFTPGIGGQVAAGRYDVFKVIRGGMGQGYASPLTERETNWPQANRVSDQSNLVVHSIHVEITRPPSDPSVYPSAITLGVAAGNVDTNIPLHPQEVSLVASGATINLAYLTNTVPVGLLQDYPAPGGAYGFNEASAPIPSTATAGAAGAFAAANSRKYLPVTRSSTVPAFERRNKVPTLLKHGDQFSMAIIFPQAIVLPGPTATPGPNGQNNSFAGAFEVVVSFWATESFVEHS